MIIEIYRITYQRYNKAVLQALLIIIQNCFNDPIYYTVIAITLVLVAVAVWQFALWYSNEKE